MSGGESESESESDVRDVHQNQNTNQNQTQNTPTPSYEKFHRVLLLGEADYSFARAFARAQEHECSSSSSSSSSSSNCRITITATEYGDGHDIATRYYNGDVPTMQNAISSLSQMEAIGDVICGLNARMLGQYPVDKCMCQRWNEAANDWHPPSSFWHTCTQNGNRNENENRNANTETDTYFDLIIFNFPHSEQAGRATKLVRALFKQLRLCIHDGRLPKDVVLEMRLRVIESDPNLKKNIRSFYNHEEAASESGFDLLGCYPSDVARWETLGYRHMWTKKNASCRDIGLNCNVWRWRSSAK